MARPLEKNMIEMSKGLAILTAIGIGFVSQGCGKGGSDAGEATGPGPSDEAAAYARGRELFIAKCTSCHGEKGEAKEGGGKDVGMSDFVAAASDDELLKFITTGRSTSDPANTSGIDMPPKGGNPDLNDEKIRDIIAYVRGLQLMRRGG